VVFIDGQYHPVLSTRDGNQGWSLQKWNHALTEDADLLELLKEGTSLYEDSFCSLNQAFASDAAQIRIHAEFAADQALHVVHVTRAGGGVATSPRLTVVVEEGAKATLLESFVTLGLGEVLVNSVTDVRVAAGATLSHVIAEKNGPAATHVSTTRVLQEQGSHYNAFTLSLGGRLTRNNHIVVQSEAECTTELNGLFSVAGNTHIDNHTVIDHQDTRGTSRQLYKGILDGKGRGVFNGRIRVRPGAVGTDSQQLNKNLLLSDTARIDTKPELLIDASDVKCKHGATIGQLSDDEIFYFQSRAIPRDMAERILVKGFSDDALALIVNEKIRAKLQWLMVQK
jgi:Fe-S cluster assembly protein SufD